MIFEDYFKNVFGDFDDDFFNETPKLDGKENYSYYHKVEDKFDNEEHTHTEKEVKNGRVLKDIKKTYKLGNKKNDEPKKITSDTEQCVEKTANEKDVEIKKLNATIDNLMNENKKLEEKIKRIEDLIK